MAKSRYCTGMPTFKVTIRNSKDADLLDKDIEAASPQEAMNKAVTEVRNSSQDAPEHGMVSEKGLSGHRCHDSFVFRHDGHGFPCPVRIASLTVNPVSWSAGTAARELGPWRQLEDRKLSNWPIRAKTISGRAVGSVHIADLMHKAIVLHLG